MGSFFNAPPRRKGKPTNVHARYYVLQVSAGREEHDGREREQGRFVTSDHAIAALCFAVSHRSTFCTSTRGRRTHTR